jgi:hypothetical protein
MSKIQTLFILITVLFSCNSAQEPQNSKKLESIDEISNIDSSYSEDQSDKNGEEVHLEESNPLVAPAKLTFATDYEIYENTFSFIRQVTTNEIDARTTTWDLNRALTFQLNEGEIVDFIKNEDSLILVYHSLMPLTDEKIRHNSSYLIDENLKLSLYLLELSNDLVLGNEQVFPLEDIWYRWPGNSVVLSDISIKNQSASFFSYDPANFPFSMQNGNLFFANFESGQFTKFWLSEITHEFELLIMPLVNPIITKNSVYLHLGSFPGTENHYDSMLIEFDSNLSVIELTEMEFEKSSNDFFNFFAFTNFEGFVFTDDFDLLFLNGNDQIQKFISHTLPDLHSNEKEQVIIRDIKTISLNNQIFWTGFIRNTNVETKNRKESLFIASYDPVGNESGITILDTNYFESVPEYDSYIEDLYITGTELQINANYINRDERKSISYRFSEDLNLLSTVEIPSVSKNGYPLEGYIISGDTLTVFANYRKEEEYPDGNTYSVTYSDLESYTIQTD